MHTAIALSSTAFDYRRDGESVRRADVLPSVSLADRLGVVMADPTDGLGAGNLVLACVTAFYDRLRERHEDFYEYPDYFTFQAATAVVDYLEFDIWPDHKHVAVPPDPEAVLRAVNDRAVTLLLVPAGDPTTPVLEDVTRNSARRRIDACIQYAPDGRLDDAEFAIELPQDPAARWYRETAATMDDPPAFDLPADDGTPIRQEYRRIDLSTALRHLPTRSP
jgi:hypothetical protein